MSRQWLRQAERGSPAALRLISWIALRFGRAPARALLYPITLFFMLFAVPQRRASRAYLRRVLARKPGPWDMARHIHCFSATILDRFFLLRGELARFKVTLHGEAALLAQLGQGRGGILLGAHLGSFEILRVLALRHPEVSVKILMYRDHNQMITRFLESLNPEVAAMVIDLAKPDALFKAYESVRNGEFLGILGDRLAESDKSCECRFLGSPVLLPTGPALLASMLDAPIILFFGLYRGKNRYDIFFELLTDGVAPDRARRQAEAQAWTCEYARRLEARVRSAPYNWFNFYDYWNELD